MTNQNEIQTFGFGNDMIDRFKSLAAEQPSTGAFAKPGPGRVELSGGQSFDEVNVRLVNIDLYQGRWDGATKKMIRKLDAIKLEDGFQRRADLVGLTADEQKTQITFNIAPSSLKNLTEYILSLAAKGIEPHQVVTRISGKQVHGNYGTFSVFTFKPVGMVQQPAPPVNVTPPQAQAEMGNPSQAIPDGWQ